VTELDTNGKVWYLKSAAGDRLMYSRVTFTKSSSFYMTTFSESLTKPKALVSQSGDCSCHWSSDYRNALIHSYNFAFSTVLWHQPRIANVSCARSWGLYGINLAIHNDFGKFVTNNWDSYLFTFVIASVCLYTYRSILFTAFRFQKRHLRKIRGR
jgi:hypothetical protein